MLKTIVAGLVAEVEGLFYMPSCKTVNDCGSPTKCECVGVCVCHPAKPEFVATTFTSHSEKKKNIYIWNPFTSIILASPILPSIKENEIYINS